jgi:hypothetical protein
MGGMSELRYRRPDEAAASAPDKAAASAPDEAGHQDSPVEDREDSERTGIDVRLDRSDGGYDPDAAFKRPVSKPPGYLPDDTGGRASVWAALRRRGDKVTEPSPRHDPVAVADPAWWEASAGVPRLPEGEADGDAPRADVDRPDFRDPLDDRSPDRYGTPLTRPDGTRIPCLNGPPRREQTRQGWAGDCGIIATLGAVAAHMPEEITRRVLPQEDGSYQVTLSEARGSGGVTEPTGREIKLTVTPELPVYDENPGTPACAKTEEGTAWCPIMEKAFAGVDQTWTTQRRVTWMDAWAGMCAQDQADNAEEQRSGPAPTGYVRLHQGTTPWERAEALTQLTGQPAVVREFPTGRDEWTINRIIRAQLTDDKPILVSSRPKTHEDEHMPHRLEAKHVYEVTGVEKGKIILRNPWNYRHPEPMETEEFARNMRRYYSTSM